MTLEEKYQETKFSLSGNVLTNLDNHSYLKRVIRVHLEKKITHIPFKK